jgi:hypothetical protein
MDRIFDRGRLLIVFGSPGGAGMHDRQSKTSRCDVSSFFPSINSSSCEQ